MRPFKQFILITLSAYASLLNAQWCCLDTLLKIPDRDTVSLKLNISGAFNNNLADPGQGLCGVRIRFNHKFIGDLVVELVSPQGQRVRLLGPIGNSGKTDFTKWFVTFVPCGSLAIPDFGFKAKWDNNQAWGILGKFYTGTYYPNTDCLEDFNLGPVDGTWTLSVSDNERFYDGSIESFCLLFCDQNGINCTDCSPNGGYFLNTKLAFCKQAPQIPVSDTIVFPTFIPDNSKYSYSYILSRQDTIIQIGPYPDLKLLPVGDYELCGISYLKMDSSSLPIPGYLLSSFKLDVLSNALGICAELSKNCLSISVFQSYDAGVQNVFLCPGDSIILNNEKFDQSGIYRIDFKTKDQCDSVLTLNLQLADIKINALPIDTVSCLKPNVFIDLRNSIVTTKSTFRWSTVNGNIVDQSDPLHIQVNDAGIYKLIIQDGNCMDSAEFIIIKTGNAPSLQMKTDTITCSKPVAIIRASTNAINPQYHWSNGQQQIGMDSSLLVTVSGEYYLTITDENGCTNYSSVHVVADTIPALLQLFAGDLSCRDSVVTLSYATNKELMDIVWDGPMGYLSSTDTSFTTNPGWYVLTAMSTNHCWSKDSIYVNNLATVPDYTVDIDTLTCSKRSFLLQDRSSSFIDSIRYFGPNGISFDDFNPEITQPGFYTVSLFDSLGCSLDTSFNIPIDSSTAEFTLRSGQFDCLNDSIQLGINFISDSVGLSFSWTGPSGFTSLSKNPLVHEAGLYNLAITTPNGCIKSESLIVGVDSLQPDASIELPLELTCSRKQVILKGLSLSAVQYDWSGPANFKDTIQEPAVSVPGVYKLRVTAANGCTNEAWVQVFADTVLPIKMLSTDSINCVKDSAIIVLNTSHTIDSISWSGPMGLITDTDSVLIVRSGGEYHLFVRGTNGCEDSARIHVLMDTIAPQILLNADTLDCLRFEANIRVLTNDTNLLYQWILTNGDSLMTKDLKVSTAGRYSLIATANNGCSVTEFIDVVELKGRPVVTKLMDSLTCLKKTANIGLNSMDPMLIYHWSGPGGFVATDSIVQVDTPGWYVFKVTNQSGCITLDSIWVRNFTDTPRVSFNSPVIDCLTKNNPLLRASFIDSLLTFQWTDPGGNILMSREVSPTVEGYYVFDGENAYGCKIRDSLWVQFDTLPPRIIKIHLDTLDCSTSQVVPLVETFPVNCNYFWTGPGLTPTNSPNPVMQQAGIFNLSLTSANHCTLDTFITVVSDTSIPVIQAIGGELDCNVSSLKLRLNSPDSLIMVFWQGPGGVLYNVREPTVSDTGWYLVVARGINDCLVFDSAFVSINNKTPDLMVDDQFIPCDPDSIALSSFTTDTSVVYSWLGPKQFTSNLRSPFVTDTGNYILTLTASNQCKTTDTIRVSFRTDLPDLLLQSDSINCFKNFATITAICDSAQLQIKWIGPGMNDSFGFTKMVTDPGWYHAEITNKYGCKNDTSLFVIADTIKPVAQIGQLDSLICEHTSVKLFRIPGSSGTKVTWTSLNGLIIGSSSGDSILVGSSGIYHLWVSSPENGCEDSSSIQIVDLPSTLASMNLSIKQPSCFGSMDGEIQINPAIGGYRPYSYTFNGKDYMDLSTIRALKAGRYNLQVKDRFGCILDTSLTLSEPAPLTLDLGRDTTIRLGDQIQISPVTNANISRLNSLEWIPGTDLDCTSCFEVWSSPKSDIRYILRIVDENGCNVEDSITIRLILTPEIYVPNVFSPNRDEINDRVIIQTSPLVERILSFQIFDRWGNKVYHKNDFIPDRSELLWDGSANGKLLNPAVFVYFIEAKLIDGNIFFQRGDISLIR